MAFPLAQRQPLLDWGGDMPSTQDDILARYLRLREISKTLHEEVLKSISGDAILLIEQRHDTVGLIATDILRNSKVWLLDVGLESSMDDGELIATRLLTPGPFSMTAGVNVPFEIEMLEPVCMLLPQRIGNSKLSRIAEDRRFAEAVYKVGLADGVMDRLAYLDLPDRA
jgi:hypothetical protein